MKKIYLLSILMICGYLLKSQTSFSISGGVKMIPPDSRTVTLLYVDESPSQDNIYKDVKQSGNLCINFAARYQDNDVTKNYHLFVEGQGYFGSLNGIALNTGLFYRKNFDSKFILQPELAFVIGFSSKGIGEIENNDIYIQVNNTHFQDYTNVNVAVRNLYYGIKPGLNFVFKTGTFKEMGFGVGYQLSLKSGKLVFSGTNQDGNATTDSEKLTASNVGFYVDGDKTDKVPFNPDGLEFKIFYNF